MIYKFQRITGKYKLLEDTPIKLDPKNYPWLVKQLERKKVRMSAVVPGHYILPADTVVTIGQWRETKRYTYGSFRVVGADNKGNPWAGKTLPAICWEGIEFNMEKLP